jgi:hypothetical protein
MTDKASDKNHPISEESSFIEAFETNFNDQDVLKNLKYAGLYNQEEISW